MMRTFVCIFCVLFVPTLALAEEDTGAGAASAEGGTSNLDSLKSGKFLKHGFTAGLGVAWTLPARYNGTGVSGFNVSAMPYVAAFPAYWGQGDVTREYCASALNGEDAQAAADAFAIKKTVARVQISNAECLARKINDLYFTTTGNDGSANNPGVKAKDENCDEVVRSRNESMGKLVKEINENKAHVEQGGGSDETAQLAGFLEDPSKHTVEEFNKLPSRMRRLLIFALTGWDVAKRGTCVLNHFGLTVGVPLKFDANTFLDGKESVRTVQPVISTGLMALLFTNYVGVMAGFHVSNVSVKEDASDEESASRNRLIFAPYVGLGGSIDFVSLLIPK